MDQGTRNAEGNGQQRDRGDNLANLNPDDIESMTVLKGAAAAPLYSSRAAAGAIIITTKSGQKNHGIGVNFTSSYSTSQALNFLLNSISHLLKKNYYTPGFCLSTSRCWTGS